MNLNEVIANYSNKSLGEKLGEYKKVHPNDHCNMGQSSNDSFPTAMHISIVLETNKNLLKKIDNFIKILEKKKRISKYNKGWTNSSSRCNSYICWTRIWNLCIAS